MEIIDDYEYNKKDLIGHGAFAAVFAGRNRKKPLTKVAIKIIKKKKIHISTSLECWAKEIKILKELSCLNHENIVIFMDCKETTNHVYIFMEYCNGGDLSDYITAKGMLSEDTIYLFLKQIAAAMMLLYSKGIIHRDLKPQNILLCYPPGMKDPPAAQIVVKIADFGLARFLQDGVMAATFCGSPIYMAPEVIMTLQYDAKADLWSIGTVVFQCLTGKPPFVFQFSSDLKHFYEDNAELQPNIPDGTSPALKDLLYRMLKRNAKDRIEFEDFFNHTFLQPPSPAAPSSPVPVPYRCPSFSSDSSTTQKVASTSPLSAQMEYSPLECSLKDDKLDQTLVNTDYPMDEFLGASQESRCSTLTEDFVMVPEEMGIDGSDGLEEDKMDEDGNGCIDTPPPSLNIAIANPVAMKVIFKKDSSNNLNASRPLSLKVTSPTPSAMTTVPIPVPNQRSRYEKMMGGNSTLAVNKLQNAMGAKTEQKLDSNKKEKILVRRVSETKLAAPDVGTLSPPVQFSIGIPPGQGGQWRRSSVSTSPHGQGSSASSLGMNTSPLKRSNTIPVCLSPVQISALVPLTAIQGSSTKVPGHYQYPTSNIGAFEAQLWSQRASNVPENFFSKEFNENVAIAAHLMGLHASNTEPELRHMTEDGWSLLSHLLFREAFGPHLHGQVNERPIIPFTQSYGVKRERVNSSDSDKSESAERGERSSGYFCRNSDKSGSAERGERSSRYFRRNSETSPSLSLMYTHSPINMEGPIKFTAPELTEETLMDDTHNMTMAKLNFVLDLVECILELAHIKGSKMKTFTDSVICRQGEALSAELTKLTDTQRCVEQLILYVRSLHLLSSSLQLARDEINQGRLMATSSLKSVVRQMNELYHRSVLISRQLQQRLGIAVQNALNPKLLVATADKLLYNYAIEMCQGAALDELYGDPRECFKRYQTAQILLHSVSQQAYNKKDKESLRKYQGAVEQRLASLQMHVKTYTYPYMTSS